MYILLSNSKSCSNEVFIQGLLWVFLFFFFTYFITITVPTTSKTSLRQIFRLNCLFIINQSLPLHLFHNVKEDLPNQLWTRKASTRRLGLRGGFEPLPPTSQLCKYLIKVYSLSFVFLVLVKICYDLSALISFITFKPQ